MDKKYKMIAVDDEHLSTRLIENFSKNHARLTYLQSFNDAETALQFISKQNVDIVILDIEMPEINGLEFAKKCPPQTKIIFSTAYHQFAIEGFNLSATDYLLKPYSVERFNTALEKAIHQLDLESKIRTVSSPEAEYIIVKSNYVNQKIPLNLIRYIESFDDYITIHLQDKDPVIVRKSMKKILEEIPDDKFMRIHRSYAVSLDKVVKFQKSRVVIGETELPVSNQYKDQLQSAIQS